MIQPKHTFYPTHSLTGGKAYNRQRQQRSKKDLFDVLYINTTATTNFLLHKQLQSTFSLGYEW